MERSGGYYTVSRISAKHAQMYVKKMLKFQRQIMPHNNYIKLQ